MGNSRGGADAVRQVEGELQDARGHLESMRAARSFPDYERCWRRFLVSTGTACNKVERLVQTNPALDAPFAAAGGFKRKRQANAVVAYARAARNTHEHSIEPITEHRPGSTTMMIGGPMDRALGIPPGPVYVEKFVTGGPSGPPVLEYRGSHPLHIMSSPPITRVLPARPRPNLAPILPPNVHEGRAINGDPLAVAEIAIAFFEEAVGAIRREIAIP